MRLNNQEQEVLENFRKLIPENRAIAQSNVSVALAAQENTKNALKLGKSKPTAGNEDGLSGSKPAKKPKETAA